MHPSSAFTTQFEHVRKLFSIIFVSYHELETNFWFLSFQGLMQTRRIKEDYKLLAEIRNKSKMSLEEVVEISSADEYFEPIPCGVQIKEEPMSEVSSLLIFSLSFFLFKFTLCHLHFRSLFHHDVPFFQNEESDVPLVARLTPSKTKKNFKRAKPLTSLGEHSPSSPQPSTSKQVFTYLQIIVRVLSKLFHPFSRKHFHSSINMERKRTKRKNLTWTRTTKKMGPPNLNLSRTPTLPCHQKRKLIVQPKDHHKNKIRYDLTPPSNKIRPVSEKSVSLISMFLCSRRGRFKLNPRKGLKRWRILQTLNKQQRLTLIHPLKLNQTKRWIKKQRNWFVPSNPSFFLCNKFLLFFRKIHVFSLLFFVQKKKGNASSFTKKTKIHTNTIDSSESSSDADFDSESQSDVESHRNKIQKKKKLVWSFSIFFHSYFSVSSSSNLFVLFSYLFQDKKEINSIWWKWHHQLISVIIRWIRSRLWWMSAFWKEKEVETFKEGIKKRSLQQNSFFKFLISHLSLTRFFFFF